QRFSFVPVVIWEDDRYNTYADCEPLIPEITEPGKMCRSSGNEHHKKVISHGLSMFHEMINRVSYLETIEIFFDNNCSQYSECVDGFVS
ncbi:hypothetical protein, partial [Vibrio metoecus]|uniref:hypothetical protein n=1 Tax=Vibrio metoecus TaxID=1481663 RepID=UPI0005116A11